MLVKDKKLTDRIDNKGGGKIISIIKILVQPLVKHMNEFSDKKKSFLIAMENYFTLSKGMSMLWEFFYMSYRHCKVLSWVAWSKCQVNLQQPNKFQ